MYLSIKYKLFVVTLLTTSTVVFISNLLYQWSFGTGFLQYVNQMEQTRIERVCKILENSYALNGSWVFLQKTPATWFSLLTGAPPDARKTKEAANQLLKLYAHAETPPHHRIQSFNSRIFLLDPENKIIFGIPTLLKEAKIKPLIVNDTTIGYIGLAPKKDFTEIHQLQFASKQKMTFSGIALSMILLASLLTFPLVTLLIRPVKAITNATHALAGGKYETRTHVTSTDELGHLSRNFNALATSLQKNEQARRQFGADISHELRTPLAVIRGEIEALQDGVHSPTPQTLGLLHSQAIHLGRLIDDLYELSMSDIGALNYQKTRIDPISILLGCIALFKPRFTQKGLSLKSTLYPKRPLRILADPQRLHQLFNNLLENTLRYTTTPGQLDITLDETPQLMTLHFMDSAPGVPSHLLPRLFDRLFRVEESRSREMGGVGLGMAISKNIVEAHEGTIGARQSPHGGLWVTINIPLTS